MCAVTPSETVGPYPSHANLLRSDIRDGKAGTTLTLTITVVNTNDGCNPVSGASVGVCLLKHCPHRPEPREIALQFGCGKVAGEIDRLVLDAGHLANWVGQDSETPAPRGG